ncbi:MAG: putative transcriptional regulator [Desulfotomaculum sp. 46_296]|nr:MAG: putative transcriptional regulator [Desulfotomaculum sp. 46_296]HAU31360.1 ArsR family transcriptional regulator [Desulfotomaculum sp.]
MINRLKALGDPHRQNILKLLASQEMGACEIIKAIGLSQPAIAHHLKILKQAGLINSEKEGKIVFYTLNKEGLKEFLEQMNGFLEDLTCFSCSRPKPSPLRQNPNLCIEMGFDPEVCEKMVHEEEINLKRKRR